MEIESLHQEELLGSLEVTLSKLPPESGIPFTTTWWVFMLSIPRDGAYSAYQRTFPNARHQKILERSIPSNENKICLMVISGPWALVLLLRDSKITRDPPLSYDSLQKLEGSLESFTIKLKRLVPRHSSRAI